MVENVKNDERGGCADNDAEIYRMLLKHIPNRFFLKDLELKYVICNEAYAIDLKINPSQISGKNDYDFFPKQLADKYRRDDEEIIRTGRTMEITESYMLNGAEYAVRTIKKPIRDDSDRITGVFGVFYDVTDQYQAEKELEKYRKSLENMIAMKTEEIKESETKFRSVAENAFVGIMILQDGMVRYINRYLATLLGYTVEEMMQWPAFAIVKNTVHPAYTETVKNQVVKKQTGDSDVVNDYPIIMITKSGAEKWMHVNSGTALFNGKKADLVVLSDISALKQAEAGMAANEEKYRSIFETEKDALFLLEPEKGAIVDINYSALEMYGYSANELLGSPMEKLAADPDAFRKILGAFVNGRVKNLDLAISIKKDGSKFPTELSAGVFIMKGLKYVTVASRDITERVRILGELKENFEKLEKLDRLKSEFTGLLAHELRSPMTAIKGFAAFLDRGAAGPLNTVQKDMVGLILGNTDKQLKIIGDMLDAAKMDAGEFVLEIGETELVGIARATVRENEGSALGKNVRIDFAAEPSQITAFADSFRISQAMTNLISNGVKFSKADSVIEVSLCLMEPGANEFPPGFKTAEPRTRYAYFSVRDCGIGIDEKHLSALFNRFSQAGGVEYRRKGTGLGLYISRLIVEAHKGFIWAESAGEGKGTVFKFVIPAQ